MKLTYDVHNQDTDPDFISKIKEMDLEKIKELILRTASVAWDDSIKQNKLDKWIDNFNGEALGDSELEKILAAWMLLNFVYFTFEDVRTFCRTIYKEFIHYKLIEYKRDNTLQDKTIEERINHIHNNTLFIALGNESESGSNILYYFRQENKLSKKLFEKKLDLKYENVVFIDDVTISGGQAYNYIKKINIDADNKYFLAFISTEDALDMLSHEGLIVLSGYIVSEREKCFSEDSYVFSNVEKTPLLEISKTMCQHYGELILKGHFDLSDYPLGYDDGQQMFGFYYNTPDNSLPIFWGNLNDWYPVFKRYDKIYGRKEVSLDDSIYV